jgi:hypothetical protein
VIINIYSVTFILLHVSAHEGHPQRKLREEYIYRETLSNLCIKVIYNTFTKRYRKLTLLIHTFDMILSQMYSFVTKCSLTMAFTGRNTYNHYYEMTSIILCAISWKYCICITNSCRLEHGPVTDACLYSNPQSQDRTQKGRRGGWEGV